MVDFFGPVDFIRLEESIPDNRASRFATGRKNLLGGSAGGQPERARMASPITYVNPTNRYHPL